MQSVAVDDANPLSGEEAYVLQVSIPSAPGVDGGALMDKIGRFVELYLTAAQPEDARFAQMGGTTWVIAAPAEAAFVLDQARADLATTLFGADHDSQVQLEWPDGVVPVDPDLNDDSESEFAGCDAGGEAFAAPESQTVSGDEEGVEVQSRYAPPAEEVPVFAASSDSAEDTTVDDGFEMADDAWTLSDTPSAPSDEPQDPIFESDDIDIEEFDPLEASPDTVVSDADEFVLDAQFDTATGDDDDVFVIDDLIDEGADAIAATVEEASGASEPATSSDATDSFDDEAAYTIEVATAAQRAAFDDDSDVFEVDAYDIEIIDSPETADPVEVYTPLSGLAEAVADNADGIDEEILETLTEVPERPQSFDIAQELGAFRQEMREIAQSIPGETGGEVLAEFRAELEAISGSLGQRVDGAAQRIEAAASQVTEAVDADRLNAAADRAERSAEQLEAGVAEALKALNTAVKAMSGEGAASLSDVAG